MQTIYNEFPENINFIILDYANHPAVINWLVANRVVTAITNQTIRPDCVFPEDSITVRVDRKVRVIHRPDAIAAINNGHLGRRNNDPTEVIELVPQFDPPMTNEQVLATFLKEHRKFTAFKRYWFRPFNQRINIVNAIIRLQDWQTTKEGRAYWTQLSSKWVRVCEHFNLQGTFTFEELSKIR